MIDEHAIILASLEDPSEGLADLWSGPLASGRSRCCHSASSRPDSKPRFLLSRGCPCPFVLVGG